MAERLLSVGGKCWHCGDTEIVHLGSETIDKNTNKKFKIDTLCNSYRYYLRVYRKMGRIKLAICVLLRRIVASRH